MRFAVLAKNVILDAVAVEKVPWVRVLDAYAITRLRADAHPARRPGKGYDCLHYCLPGMPDLYNGRLLTILRDQERGRLCVLARALLPCMFDLRDRALCIA